MNKYIIISGSTASGKTKISIDIAKHLINKGLKSEIINFDSLLFYKELNIGTAKPTLEEQDGIIHHLIDTNSITEPMNVSDFILKANQILNDLFKHNIIPILVGGSAFYIRALVKGMIDSSEEKNTSQVVFNTINEIKKDNDGVINFLKKNDPEIFNFIHFNDDYRLTRAVEFYLHNQRPYSTEIKRIDENKPYDFSHNNLINGEMLHLYLEIEKEAHLNIIQERAYNMVHGGLIDEVENILQQNFDKNLKPLTSIGYKETINFIENQETLNKNDLIESIYIATRQLAKAQKTFFRKIKPKITLSPLDSPHNLFNLVDEFTK